MVKLLNANKKANLLAGLVGAGPVPIKSERRRTFGPPDKSGCTGPAGLWLLLMNFAINKFFNHFPAFPCLNLTFTSVSVIFIAVLFFVDEFPVICFSSKSFVIGIVSSNPFINIVAGVADIEFIQGFRINDVEKAHNG